MDPRLKKLIRDYNYLSDTLEDVKEISAVAEGEFKVALFEEDPDAAQALAPPKTQEIKLDAENVEVVEEPSIEQYNDPKFKKLFRKVAVKCHPDKLGDMNSSEAKFLKKVYEDLTEANRNHDWGMLLKLSMELDVDCDDIGIDEMNNIAESISTLQKEISRYENSMAFSWYTKNDEKSKKEYLAVCISTFKSFLEKIKDPKDLDSDI
jgi:hypothetical protein